jgi:hypothetical protein
MVVVPTSNDVRLTFDRSTSDLFFYALTGIGILLLIASRIWGDKLLARLGRTGLPPVTPTLAVAGWYAAGDDRSPWPEPDPGPSSWAPPDLTPPRGWMRDDQGPPATAPVRDVDDDPATDAGGRDGEADGPLA